MFFQGSSRSLVEACRQQLWKSVCRPFHSSAIHPVGVCSPHCSVGKFLHQPWLGIFRTGVRGRCCSRREWEWRAGVIRVRCVISFRNKRKKVVVLMRGTWRALLESLAKPPSVVWFVNPVRLEQLVGGRNAVWGVCGRAVCCWDGHFPLAFRDRRPAYLPGDDPKVRRSNARGPNWRRLTEA